MASRTVRAPIFVFLTCWVGIIAGTSWGIDRAMEEGSGWSSKVGARVSAAQAAGQAGTAQVPEGLIYASFPAPNRNLFLVEGDSIRPLTQDEGLEYHATASPDGKYVVYTSEQGGDPDLFILELETGATRPLYATEAFEDAAEISPDGKRIAFVSTRDGSAQIYVGPFRPKDPAALDEAKLLTPEEGADFRPAFSPDGRWIAYSSTRGLELSAGSHLWIVPVDGEGEDAAPRRIVAQDGWNGSPAWSPDGKAIVYHQLIPYPGAHPDIVAASRIWKVDLASGEREALSEEGRLVANPAFHPDKGWIWAEKGEAGWHLDLPSAPPLQAAVVLKDGRIVGHGLGPRPAGEGLMPMLAPVVQDVYRHSLRTPELALDLQPVGAPFPALSPDGKTLASGIMELQFLDLATGKIRGVFRPEGLAPSFPSVWDPNWAPDGKWLVFTAGPGFAPPDAPADVWRVNADGSEGVNLTADSPGNDGMAVVGPEGRWIVFRSGRSDHQMDLYLMDADGSNVRRLTHDPAVDTMPAFSPDGRQIVFVSTRGGHHDVYTLSLSEEGEAAGEPRQITDSPGFDVHPTWSPDGKWLVVTTDRWGWNDELDYVDLNFQPYGELAAVRLADRHVVRLTFNNWEEGHGEWLDRGLNEVFGSFPAPSPRL